MDSVGKKEEAGGLVVLSLYRVGDMVVAARSMREAIAIYTGTDGDEPGVAERLEGTVYVSIEAVTSGGIDL